MSSIVLQHVCVQCFAAGLAVLGAAVGIVFRLKVLVPVIGVLLCASIIFSISRSFSFLDAALVVIAAQAILQGGYFAGLFVRHVIGNPHFRSGLWSSRLFEGRRKSEIRQNDHSTANQEPPANSGDSA